MKDLTVLQEKIGVQFNNPDLLINAVTHATYVHEHRGEKLESNEGLEHLGNYLLMALVTTEIFHLYPERGIGGLNELRTFLTNKPRIFAIAEKLGLSDHLLLGKGERSGPTPKPRLVASAFEAIIGALYLDQGMEAARRFIKTFIVT